MLKLLCLWSSWWHLIKIKQKGINYMSYDKPQSLPDQRRFAKWLKLSSDGENKTKNIN